MLVSARAAILPVLFALAAATAASAQYMGPFPVDKVAGKTGRFLVIFNERSPLSQSAEVAKRSSQKISSADADYDLAKESFEAFVPKSPADDGAYGLMVAMPLPAHGFPPPRWVDVLEKHHMIWLGDSAAGDGRPVLQRIGLALDAVHNAQKTWKIDPKRIYVCLGSGATPAAGIALYYPDVFQGQFATAVFAWFTKISDTRARAIYNTDKLPRPLPEQLTLAKTRTRFFFAGRNDDTAKGSVDPNKLIVNDGYEKMGFKYVKAVYVPTSDMNLWSTYTADWFDQGVEFLDAHAAEANAHPAGKVAAAESQTQTGTFPAPASATSGTASSPPAAAPDDANRKAAAALSMAKNYINVGQFDPARKKLQSILQTYPNSPAAGEAKTLMKEIQDK
jgi:hypothetical protein